jgi:hypothetical protein
MPEPDAAPKANTLLTPYWADAVGYAVCYYAVCFPVEWIWARVAGDPFDAASVARSQIATAILFGLGMPLVRRFVRRRKR